MPLSAAQVQAIKAELAADPAKRGYGADSQRNYWLFTERAAKTQEVTTHVAVARETVNGIIGVAKLAAWADSNDSTLAVLWLEWQGASELDCTSTWGKQMLDTLVAGGIVTAATRSQIEGAGTVVETARTGWGASRADVVLGNGTTGSGRLAWGADGAATGGDLSYSNWQEALA